MSLSMFQAFVLAIVQGLTEWLPVSSSGHLAISYMVLGVEPPLMFNLMVHVGTLGAVTWMFRRELKRILCAVPRMLQSIVFMSLPSAKDREARMAFYLAAATVPAAVAGFVLKGHAESAFSSIPMLSAAFIFTGIVLLSTRGLGARRSEHRNTRGNMDALGSGSTLTPGRGMVVGLAQILTIFPGVSRSGLTISAGLHSGIARMEAARFSFLLSIPLILGSALFEAYTTHTATLSPDILPQMILGAIVSLIVGLMSLRLLIGIIARGRFYLFAPYCISIGSGLLIWSML